MERKLLNQVFIIDLKKLQKEVYQNKIDKGFDIRDNKENIYKQFNFIQGEVAEAFEAYHKSMDTLGEELADVCLYILGLCEIKGISLEKELLNKINNENIENTIEINKITDKTLNLFIFLKGSIKYTIIMIGISKILISDSLFGKFIIFLHTNRNQLP